MKTMAEVLAEHQYDRERAVCMCSELVQVGLRCDPQTHPEHVAEVLTAAGFGPVRDAKAGALRDAAVMVRGQRPEVGTHINVSEYRMGKNDALTIAAMNIEALATVIEADNNHT